MGKLKAALMISAVLAAALPAPASAALMLATWQGTIASGSVSASNGNPVDGLALGDYTGQAFTASFLYGSDPVSDQMYFHTPGVSTYLFGGNGYGPSPILSASITVGGVTIDLTSAYEGLAQQNSNTGLVEQQSLTQWNLGGPFHTEYFSKGITLTGYGAVPGDLDQEFSLAFDPSSAATGSVSDCDVIDDYSHGFSESVPYCLSLNLKPTSLTIVDPPTGVPEPGVWALLLSGFGLAGAMLRRRRQELGAGLA